MTQPLTSGTLARGAERCQPTASWLHPDWLGGLAPTWDPLFSHDQVRQLPVRSVPAGEVIYRQGEPSTSMLYVAQGRVKVVTRQSPGAGALELACTGDLFGEECLVEDRRHSSATAIIRTDLRELVPIRFEQLLGQHPGLARGMINHLSRRWRHLRVTNAGQTRTSTVVRVARCLASLTVRIGVEEADGLMVDHGLTQTDLSLMVGSSRETFNKTFLRLAERGWFEVGQRSFLVTNGPALFSLAGCPTGCDPQARLES